MCFEKIAEKISLIDQLGVPVSLNLNKQAYQKTSLGGCCSLIVVLIILITCMSEIFQVFVN